MSTEPSKREPRTFSPQSYPLFIAEWNEGDPLVGRIIGWGASSFGVPRPWVAYETVAFDARAETGPPLIVDWMTTRVSSGPSWIRDSYDEAKAAADAYVPPEPA